MSKKKDQPDIRRIISRGSAKQQQAVAVSLSSQIHLNNGGRRFFSARLHEAKQRQRRRSQEKDKMLLAS